MPRDRRRAGFTGSVRVAMKPRLAKSKSLRSSAATRRRASSSGSIDDSWRPAGVDAFVPWLPTQDRSSRARVRRPGLPLPARTAILGMRERESSMTDITAAGAFALGDRTVNRMGYGAMQLAGRGVFGPPKDRDEALAVLRAAIAAGVNHIDTSDFYGPHVTNQIIREALHPYPDGLVIVTKLGAVRGEDASWNPALSTGPTSRAAFTTIFAISRLMRWTWSIFAWAALLTCRSLDRRALHHALAELQRQGLIRQLGVGNVIADPGETGARNRGGGLRAERLQPGPPGRRRLHR